MRRRPPEDPDHHERWMVSYADFVTLLFAFFVVMYAISSINEGKYKQMTQSMIAAFNQGSISPKVIGQSGSANTHVAVEDANPMTSKVAASLKQQQDMRMRQLAAQVRQLLDPLMQRGQVRVTDSPLGIAVEINDSALFESGQATPSTASVGWLGRLGGVLKAHPNRIRVEGYTDDRPIRTSVYPSNWELSAARAGSVVRLFVENGVASPRLVAIGRAENRPVASNDHADGRARNRRVTISILPESAGDNDLVPVATLSSAPH